MNLSIGYLAMAAVAVMQIYFHYKTDKKSNAVKVWGMAAMLFGLVLILENLFNITTFLEWIISGAAIILAGEK